MTEAERISRNVVEVRQRIADAASRAGREASDITLIAVTKYSDEAQTRAIISAGCLDLGENRPQQLWEKSAALSDAAGARWHQIGHLQRNKVAKTVPIIDLLHSVDSLRLLEQVDRAAQECAKRQPILLEVNVSGDASKHGWRSSEMGEVITSALEFENVEVQGLMTMATLGGSPDATRRNFDSLRQLRDRLQNQVDGDVRLQHLSMGMSGDFEIAIEEGATMVRVGSALLK